jgi:hypothetical protein
VLAVRNPLVDLVWSGVRLPTLTISSIWLDRRSITLLPIITGRGLNTHTMISGILFYILIVGLLAYAAYLKNTMWRK